MTVTVVGGGMGGLVAAIVAAEQGAAVELHEARDQLGGRGRSSGERFVVNYGPHALYRTRPHWIWLRDRGLLPPTASLAAGAVRFVLDGDVRRVPPPALLRALPRLGADAPVDEAFRPWASRTMSPQAAEHLVGIARVVTFDHDPGRLSAAFVWDRLRWIYARPSVRFVLGGWSRLVERLEQRAVELGVAIRTGSRVEELPEPPVVVAVELGAARELLRDDTLRWEGTRTALLDVGLRSAPGDPGAVIDLDAGVFLERYSVVDRSIVPDGRELVQAQAGIRPGETLDAATGRIERSLDLAFTGWRERTEWRRRLLAEDRTGALDLPGRAWPDRPAIDRGGGVFLAGDMVAAQGFLSEVSFASGEAAARLAAAWTPAPTAAAEATA